MPFDQGEVKLIKFGFRNSVIFLKKNECISRTVSLESYDKMNLKGLIGWLDHSSSSVSSFKVKSSSIRLAGVAEFSFLSSPLIVELMNLVLLNLTFINYAFSKLLFSIVAALKLT